MKYLLSVVCLSTSAQAATLRVPGDFESIQRAIDRARNGDVVLVAPGTYVVDRSITFRGKAIHLRSEAGAEKTTLEMRDPRDFVIGGGSVVLFRSGEKRDSVLEGFTLRGGAGTMTRAFGFWIAGGGILLDGSSPTVKDCVITDNHAGIGGGVACESGSSPLLLRCTITGNSNSGIDCWSDCRPDINDCVISGNWSVEGSRSAGGLSCSARSSPIARRCTITGNAAKWGGGVEARESSRPALVFCVISGNLSTEEGGGVFSTDGADVELDASTVMGNFSRTDGGGLYCKDAKFSLLNTVVAGNAVPGGRGAETLFVNASARLGSCTLVASAGAATHVSCTDGSQLTFINSIIWAAGAPPDCGELDHCLTDRDPRFVRNGVFDFDRFVAVEDFPHEMPRFVVEAPDYHLLSVSPAIDAGSARHNPGIDRDGTPRRDDPASPDTGDGPPPHPDIGAYELARAPPVFFRRGDINGDGLFGVTDPIYLLSWSFLGGAPPDCQDAADVDDDGRIDSSRAISDAVYFLMWRYLGGPPPPGSTDCALDPTDEDGLGCASFPPCP